MHAESRRIVVCGGARTPIGHIARSLSEHKAADLMVHAVNAALERTGLPQGEVDGLVCGWVGQDSDAPNLARVALLRCGLPERSQAVTVQNNCVSSLEAVAEAARRILTGEGEAYVAGGVESMSRLPYSLMGPRSAKELRSLETVKARWAELAHCAGVSLVDSMERGLVDPVENINMAATAEVCAQLFGVSREAQDAYACESLRRCLEAWKRGFYAAHVAPLPQLEKDEYPFLREDLAARPEKFAKAPALFDNSAYGLKDFYRDFGRHMPGRTYAEGMRGTVTLFNSCARSDGAAALVVADFERAKALRLPLLAEIKAWEFYGNNPAQMGIAPALAAASALQKAGLRFEALDRIELHEPFAATVLSIFAVGKERFGHDWQAQHEARALNPNGGSIALGHPLGATGARLVLNLLGALADDPKARLGMAAACAGGGMGGAMVFERLA
ncbi:MAG TPA: acetyl-CoA C-acyltransferase [Elusimicrobia bacterium]|nr:acetyl-CoA C-acyltransferase [Elusimicrobiota bacterium]